MQQGATFAELQKGFQIAGGQVKNPYSGTMPGQVWQPSFLTMFGYDLPSEAQIQPFKEAKARGEVGEDVMFGDWSKQQFAKDAPNMEAYYSKYFGQASTGSPGSVKSPEELAMERAKQAGRGASVSGTTVGGVPTGAGSLVTASPWAVQYNEQSPWL